MKGLGCEMSEPDDVMINFYKTLIFRVYSRSALQLATTTRVNRDTTVSKHVDSSRLIGLISSSTVCSSVRQQRVSVHAHGQVLCPLSSYDRIQ